jgi:hypothetical protein
MKSIERRLLTIEKTIPCLDGSETKAIFFQSISGRRDAPEPLPVDGWRCGDIEIIRQPGESDDALMGRAVQAAPVGSLPGSVPSFYSIDGKGVKTDAC